MKDIETKAIPDLIKICDWLTADKLSLNALKTELMLLGTTRNIKKLGSLLAYISAKIRRNIGVMKLTKRYIPNDTLIMLYRALV